MWSRLNKIRYILENKVESFTYVTNNLLRDFAVKLVSTFSKYRNHPLPAISPRCRTLGI